MIDPAHFTYRTIRDWKGDLCQGDILQPSEGLLGLLAEVHPHFRDDKYTGYLVLTQTCDLVRRGGQGCKTRYVNLAVVRLLKDVVLTLLDRACDQVKVAKETVQGLYLAESRYKAEQLLHRIFNQNAQAEGLFYLHPDAGVGIAEPSVALLQVSVAVRAYEHYGVLLAARTGGLCEQFQSKLGWLIGNLFSRVGTRDLPPPERRRLVAAFLDGGAHSADFCPRWIQQDGVRSANKANLHISGMTAHEVAAIIDRHRPTPPKDVAIGRVEAALRDLAGTLTAEQIEAIKTKLASDAVFESACR